MATDVLLEVTNAVSPGSPVLVNSKLLDSPGFIDKVAGLTVYVHTGVVDGVRVNERSHLLRSNVSPEGIAAAGLLVGAFGATDSCLN